jgi:nucleotide-binding universal stress UspA family protein
MYKKVLVPMDGSNLAEVVLPHLEEIARGCSIPEIVLMSVTERTLIKTATEEVSDIPPVFLEEQHEQFAPKTYPEYVGEPLDRDFLVKGQKTIPVGKMERAATVYLNKIAAGLNKNGFNTSVHVIVGDPIEEVAKFANNEGIDLIVMASWGKHGMSKWSVANVAEKVFRLVNIPMLLIKPPEDFVETKPKRKGQPE